MNKKYIPTYLAKSLLSVDPTFFKNAGYVAVFSDLDNTLAPYDQSLPSEELVDYVTKLEDLGIGFYIASNNHGKRVKAFSKALKASSAHMLFKPMSCRLRRFLKKHDLDPRKCILVGDQVVTDVAAGNGSGMDTMLVDHLSDQKPIWTKMNASRDDKYRKEILDMSLSTDWRKAKWEH